MIKLLAFLVIAGLSVLLFYLSYLYITGKKFVKAVPTAFFLDGPLEGERLVVGPFKDKIMLALPSGVEVSVYAVYAHLGDGMYQYVLTVWEDETETLELLDLDKSNVVSYNDLTTTEQEETDDASNNSREQDRPANLG